MLEPFSVSSQDSRVTDSLMKLLKDSSAPDIAGSISSNSFWRVNKKFCRFVIDMLSVQHVFNNWYSFSAQSVPSPYVKETPQKVIDDIAHNQGVLVPLCVQLNPIFCMSIFKEGNQLCWQVPTLKKSFSSVVTMKHKLEKGINSSWEGYAENYVIIFFCVSFIIVLCHSILMFILIRITCGFIIGSSFNLPTHFFQSLPTTIYVGWGLMVSIVFSSNIKTGISSSVVWMKSCNYCITIIMMSFHVLIWSCLDSVWIRKVCGLLIGSASNRK